MDPMSMEENEANADEYQMSTLDFVVGAQEARIFVRLFTKDGAAECRRETRRQNFKRFQGSRLGS